LNQKEPQIQGFRFSATAAGIKHEGTDRLDLGLIVSDAPASAAAVTTTNLVFAAPVEITRKNLANGECQALLINSGNANSYTGSQGRQDALDLTEEVAKGLGIAPTLVVPMSTGVIGLRLPVDRMRGQMPRLLSGLDRHSFMNVARAMMTTDTRPKTVMLGGVLSDGPFTMVGMAKGAGMIAPNMATLLAVILTDIKVEARLLKDCLVEANSRSFNCITIDGDTSTNDTVIVMAGGHDTARELGGSRADLEAFSSMLNEACMSLARQIVLDGEGATKLVEVRVMGAPSPAAAARVARTIAESPLVKTAFHGEDPNWGRILCSAGRSGVEFDPDNVDLFIGEVAIVKQGLVGSNDWEAAAHKVMQGREFSVLLDLKAGEEEACFLTTDMSEEYVTINADYRS
jgi:glutamate N-acetyltransferase / amino-acid N-acetyltransferase